MTYDKNHPFTLVTVIVFKMANISVLMRLFSTFNLELEYFALVKN